MLTEKEITRIIEKIVERIQPDKIIMFGSYAKGKETQKSDLDLFIIKETHLPMRQRNVEIKPIVANLIINVDLHVYTAEEIREYGAEQYSFIHSILKTGRVVYERNNSS
jgi:predicted nucleotidyltransferase